MSFDVHLIKGTIRSIKMYIELGKNNLFLN